MSSIGPGLRKKAPTTRLPDSQACWEVGWTFTDWEADCRGYKQPVMCNKNASFCCWSTSASTKSAENSKQKTPSPFTAGSLMKTAIPKPEFAPFKHSSCNFYPVLKATCAVPPLYGLCSVLHNSSSPLEKPGRLDKDGTNPLHSVMVRWLQYHKKVMNESRIHI